MFHIRAIDCRNSLHVRFALYIEHARRQSLMACKCGCKNSSSFGRNSGSKINRRSKLDSEFRRRMQNINIFLVTSLDQSWVSHYFKNNLEIKMLLASSILLNYLLLLLFPVSKKRDFAIQTTVSLNSSAVYPVSIVNYRLLVISTRPYFQKRIFNGAANEEAGRQACKTIGSAERKCVSGIDSENWSDWRIIIGLQDLSRYYTTMQVRACVDTCDTCALTRIQRRYAIHWPRYDHDYIVINTRSFQRLRILDIFFRWHSVTNIEREKKYRVSIMQIYLSLIKKNSFMEIISWYVIGSN